VKWASLKRKTVWFQAVSKEYSGTYEILLKISRYPECIIVYGSFEKYAGFMACMELTRGRDQKILLHVGSMS
jgi:hypothetical protein